MRCVITGVAGFIGSSIADELLSQGHEVVGIDCFIDYYPEQIKRKNLESALSNNSFTFLEEDLLTTDMGKLLDGANWIFHQAAQAGVRASWGGSFSIYSNNNILATQRLLEAARQPEVAKTLQKVVYASSSSVYGTAESFPTKESTLPHPVSPYGVSKLAAEHLMNLYAEGFAVPTVSLRYFTVYGPRQRPDMAFNRFITAALKDEAITLYGDGEQSRDFTFIKDIVAANINAAQCDGSGLVLNIGGGSRVTVNEVISKLEDILGKKIKIDRHDKQVGDARHTSADVSRAVEAFGYKPKYTLDQGLKAEADWLASIL